VTKYFAYNDISTDKNKYAFQLSEVIIQSVKKQQLLPVIALLAREALQVVDVGSSPHHHLESRNHFIARGTVPRCAK